MKRYIKSAAITKYPTLLDWLQNYRSNSEFITLILLDTNRRISINGFDTLLVCDLLRFLTNTNVSKFSNYFVVDVEALGVVGGSCSYAVYIVPSRLI